MAQRRPLRQEAASISLFEVHRQSSRRSEAGTGVASLKWIYHSRAVFFTLHKAPHLFLRNGAISSRMSPPSTSTPVTPIAHQLIT